MRAIDIEKLVMGKSRAELSEDDWLEIHVWVRRLLRSDAAYFAGQSIEARGKGKTAFWDLTI